MPSRSVALLAAVIASAIAVSAQSRSSGWLSEEDIRRILVERIDHHWSAGLVVGLISRDGRLVVSHGHAGNGDMPLNGDTVFEVGSVTKAFTALVLADMVIRREVALTDPLEKFLPAGVRAPTRNGRSITLQDLATHTSGLPRMPPNLKPRDWANPYADYSVASLYAFLSEVTLPHDPGSHYEYSNVGYGLLGHLLALKSETDYETLVASRVLKPLGMQNTGISLSADLALRLASGHDVMLRRVPKWDQTSAVAAAGALHSTANDLLTLLAAILGGGDTPTRHATALMLSASRPTPYPNLRIGLGWHLLQFEGRDIVFHAGGTGGYRSFVGFDVETGTGVVVLSNTNSEADLNDIGLHLLDRRAVLLSFPPSASGDPTQLDRYTGVYAVGPGAEVAIIRIGWLLFAKETGQPAFVLSAEGDSDFAIRSVDLTRPPMYRPEVALPTRYTFDLDATGRGIALTRHDGERRTRAARVK
jgi:D-alanyl-D-alanine-carboxypeptidase/D-alanyl-D-alanine-endopeptidase